MFFFNSSDIFHFHSFGCHLGSQLWSLLQKCDPDRRDQNSHKSRLCFFYPSDIFHFHSFGCPFGCQLGSLLQKCDPDRRDQNSHESRLCFFTQQTFPIFIPLAVTWCPNLDPCDKSVILTGAIKTHIKVVYVFLPIRHLPFSFLWLSLEVPTWILAAKVWSWGLLAKFT